ncbi:hypothetical protein Nepgr_031673 [Nepenthes gracilis]|uniref:H(+)-exporting diphosphatase n=1 Tax=Nepenthes gracilis TaxID=150966 RepID=A0AAD3THT6_NEPGR|nr:hypothetical protein Nepgr_031673 [Nepenthes gracilis]
MGLLSIIASSFAIDAYGPISDNADGIAGMASTSHRICDKTDALDAAKNTTSTIGIEIAISSTALMSLALSGAFVSSVSISTIDILGPKVFIGLIVGEMCPYGYS